MNYHLHNLILTGITIISYYGCATNVYCKAAVTLPAAFSHFTHPAYAGIETSSVTLPLMDDFIEIKLNPALSDTATQRGNGGFCTYSSGVLFGCLCQAMHYLVAASASVLMGVATLVRVRISPTHVRLVSIRATCWVLDRTAGKGKEGLFSIPAHSLSSLAMAV